MGNRHLGRMIAMQVLYEWDFKGKNEKILWDSLAYNLKEFAPDYEEIDFVKNLIQGVLNHLTEIDQLIQQYAPQWPLEQIMAVDRNILRLGLYELKFDPQIPAKVAINEAIELAKAFGGESSGKFVNGVLGTVYRLMLEKGEIKEIDKQTSSNSLKTTSPEASLDETKPQSQESV